MQPSIEAEHLYGQLHFQGTVDTDGFTLGIDWAAVHAAILNASYATVEGDAAVQVLSGLDTPEEPPQFAETSRRSAIGG